MNSEGLTTPSSLGPSPPWAEARRESWAALGDDGLEDGGDWAGEEALECEGLSLLPKDPVVLCEDEGEALGEGVEGMGGGGGGGGSEWVRVTGARSLEGAGGWGAAGGMDSVDCSCRRPDDARAAVAAVPLPPSSNSAMRSSRPWSLCLRRAASPLPSSSRSSLEDPSLGLVREEEEERREGDEAEAGSRARPDDSRAAARLATRAGSMSS